jgi:hypothetical protein
MNADVLRELAKSIDPIAFCQGLGIDPDPWQRDLLLSDERQIILNCSRQSGKSFVCSVLALFHAMNHPGALILVLSPSLRQSSELFKKIMNHYHDLGRPGGATIESALTLQLSNRSRIISLPGTEKTIRGYSGVSLLLVDEAAGVDDELYMAVRPMLAVSAGRLILLSTPKGQRGFFHKVWTEGEDFFKIKITADQVPRISKDFLDEERRALGERYFEQEYFAEFFDRDDAVFDHSLVMASLSDVDEWIIDLDEDMQAEYEELKTNDETAEDEKKAEDAEKARIRRLTREADEWDLKM